MKRSRDGLPMANKNPRGISLPAYRDVKKYAGITKHAVFTGTEKELRTFKTSSLTACILLAVGAIAEGLMKIKSMQNAVYVLLPYMLEFLAVFIFTVRTVKLCNNAADMSYMTYVKTLDILPVLGVITATFTFAGLVGSVVFIAIYGFADCAAARVVYLFFKALNITAAFYSFFNLKKYDWEMKE